MTSAGPDTPRVIPLPSRNTLQRCYIPTRNDFQKNQPPSKDEWKSRLLIDLSKRTGERGTEREGQRNQ